MTFLFVPPTLLFVGVWGKYGKYGWSQVLNHGTKLTGLDIIHMVIVGSLRHDFLLLLVGG